MMSHFFLMILLMTVLTIISITSTSYGGHCKKKSDCDEGLNCEDNTDGLMGICMPEEYIKFLHESKPMMSRFFLMVLLMTLLTIVCINGYSEGDACFPQTGCGYTGLICANEGSGNSGYCRDFSPKDL
ncbi:hypothetical protein KQX54_018308 [Cotesia glomerata]|uniref:Uncharacterized protein n=1 Tax=Cotesia glomerata TaxID=32391 RepID=A0AAV7IEW4_COTGL|nr:hypothetical protein KQX54_018308 [Cotesia glomerata]